MLNNLKPSKHVYFAIGLAALCLMSSAASARSATGFASNSEAYCMDLAKTAERAAMARDRGEKYSSTYAINGYRPTDAYPTDFDVAHDRKLVAKSAFESSADPKQIFGYVLHHCRPQD